MEKIDNIVEEYVHSLHVQFVKSQDEFIKKECIRHIKDNKEATIFYIDEDKLNYIFDLGIQEYIKRMSEKDERN